MGFIRYFIGNPIAVTVFCIAVLLFGVLALTSVPIQLTPNVVSPAITVTTVYPGATPQDVEQDILIKQEEFLRSVPGLKKMTSTASQNFGEVVLEFSIDSSMEENLLRVNNALSQVPSYPENVDEPNLSTTSSSDQPVAWFSIRAVAGREQEVDMAKQFDFANDFIKTRFERIPGVASVEGVYGGESRELQVYIDPIKLAERGITIYQVREALRNNNRDVSGGSLDEGKRRYNVRTLGRFRSPVDAENTIITVRNDGTPIYVRDVGYAVFGVGESQSLIRHNGRPALAMGVRHEPGSNLLAVMDEVKATVRDLNAGMLKERDLQMLQVTDDTEYVVEAVAMVRNNLMIGGVLSLVTLLLFLRHVRSTLIIGVAVPLCIMGSLFFINATGRTINVVSLAGLAFSVGSVLDNSIVVLENIFRHRQMGKDSLHAAFEGTDEVWTAILSSSVTNVIVFLPIITLKEEAGQLFRDLAIAITATNVFSFLTAILVVPCLSVRLLHKIPEAVGGEHRGGARSLGNLYGYLHHFTAMYLRLESYLRWLMAGVMRRVVVVIAAVTVALALIFFLMPQTEYLPEGNQNSVFGLIIPPQGYNLDEMSSAGRFLEARMRPFVEGDIADYREGRLDGPPLRDFFFVAFGGSMFVFTSGQEPSLASKIPGTLIANMGEVPGVIPLAFQRSIFDPGITGSRGIELDIVGPETEVATGIAAQAFFKSMQTFPEAAPPYPVPGIEIGQPQLTIKPKWDRAAELGISATAIGYGAWVLGDGAFADEYYADGKKFDLYLYSTLGAFDTLSNFDTLRIATEAGDTVPLADVAEVDFEFVPQQIRRVDQRRAVTLTITPPTDISLEKATGMVETQIIDALRKEGAIPPGYSIDLGGSVDKLTAIREALAGEFLVAILLVYLILVLIFRHWGHPFTIMMSVPIGLTGGVLGMAALNLYLGVLTGGHVIQSLDVLTMLGFVVLLGSVVNNPILIVEQSLNFIEKGEDYHTAIVNATMTRIRPMFMTTGTTLLGLAPLVLIPGAGSELYRGLGVVMFGGLLFGTLITLVFIPSVMSLMYDARNYMRGTRISRISKGMIEKLQEE